MVKQALSIGGNSYKIKVGSNKLTLKGEFVASFPLERVNKRKYILQKPKAMNEITRGIY